MPPCSDRMALRYEIVNIFSIFARFLIFWSICLALSCKNGDFGPMDDGWGQE